MKSSNPIDHDPILTTRSVANMLGVAVSTAQLWIESGRLPSWKTPGGHRRVRRSEVTRWLAQHGAAAAMSTTAALATTGTALSGEFLPAVQPDYPVPADEAARLCAVRDTQLLDTCAEDVFDRITWLATQVTDSPMALITLLTSERQWFKSRIGMEAAQTPRSWAFCSHAIVANAPFVVEDALLDARFRANTLVTGAPFIRFYAAIPLVDHQGYCIGTLCVLDREARRLRERELRALRELAAIVTDELHRRADAAAH